MFKRRIVVIIVVLLSMLFISCDKKQEIKDTESEDVISLKSQTFTKYPENTVGEAVEGFLSDPKWISFIGEDGNKYVNVTGGMSYQKQKISAMMQFKIDIANNTFEAFALEFNGISQNKIMLKALVKKMFESQSMSMSNKTGKKITQEEPIVETKDELEMFLEKNPNLTEMDQSDLNEFYEIFASEGKNKLIEYFIDNELYTGNNEDPFEYAIKYNHISIVKTICEKLKKDANFKTNQTRHWCLGLLTRDLSLDGYNSIIEYSTVNKRIDIVKYLLSKNAKNSNKNYSLLFATMNNDYDMVKLLLENNANPNKWYTSTSALKYAQKKYNKNSKLLKLLTEYSLKFKK